MAAKQPTVLHFATWYPDKSNPVNGIFVQRQIELIASNHNYRHVVVKKSTKEISVLKYLLCFVGLFPSENNNGLKQIELPQQSFLYRSFFWRYRARAENFLLKKLIKKYAPAIAHLHVVYGFGQELMMIKEQFKIPYLISEHMGPFPFHWLPNKQLNVISPMQKADAVVAVSVAQKEQIFNTTGVNAIVIPNVIHASEFYFNKEAGTKKEGQPSIVFTGIYTKEKGADYLLKAFTEFRKKFPQSILHLAGAATDERLKVLKDLVEINNLDHSVHFYGRLNATELCRLYNQCDFYVCSSEWESFGASALEALFTGLPVLTTNCGGVPELIEPSNGIVVENNQEVNTLLNGLFRITEKLSDYSREAISDRAARKYSAAEVRDRYINLYDNILNCKNQLV